MSTIHADVETSTPASLSAPTTAPSTTVDLKAAPRRQQGLERRHRWEKRYNRRLRVTDTLIAGGSVALAAAVHVLTTSRLEDPWEVLRAPLLVLPCWLLLLSLVGSRASNIIGSGTTEYKRVAHATGFSFGVIAIVFVIFNWSGFRIQLMAALPLGMLCLLMSRWLWRRWLGRQRSQGHYVSRAIVVGSDDDIQYVLQRVTETGSLGYCVVGVTTDAPAKSVRVKDVDYPVLGTMDTVANVAQTVGADAIIVASTPTHDADYIRRLSWQLEGAAAELILSSRLTDVAGPRISLRPVDGMPLIHVRIPEFEGSRLALKRAFDLVISTAALLVTAPLAVIIGVAIKLDSKGPVFYRQSRIGLNGRSFDMIKFRSMGADADQEVTALQSQNEGAGPLFKMRNDPRITRVGRFIRKYSIDELPQFWNVFRGDMSVVGPRPPLEREVAQYHDDVFRRFYIKPGITGLWQVSGRSDLTWEESVRLDLRYVENWSILQDLTIIWRTVRVVVRPDGAY